MGMGDLAVEFMGARGKGGAGLSTMSGILHKLRPRPSTVLPDIVPWNPTHIWIEPTNRCNTRCTHCDHYYRQFGEDMPLGLYEKIRDQVLDGVERVELIGYGEPFMAKHYWEMFDECQRRGILVFSTSNGILLRDDARVSKVVRANMVLTLSIDGARKETLEFVRPYIKWHKMLETLECLKRNAEEAGPERRFRLRFNFVAMKQNFADLPDLIRLGHQYGVFEICVLPLGYEELFEKVNGQSLQDSPELVAPVMREAVPLAKELGIQLALPQSFHEIAPDVRDIPSQPETRAKRLVAVLERGRDHARRHGVAATLRKLREAATRPARPRAKVGGSYCIMPWKDAYFGSGGTVYPCCMMGEELGNLNRQEWKDIWNGPAFRNLRRTVHSWNPSLVCRKCPLLIGINGGDGKKYDKFFARFEVERLALDGPSLGFGEGFHELEFEDGRPSHRWMSRRGRLSVVLSEPAKFVRLHLKPRAPVPQLNLGTCRIGGGEPEAFDNSCDRLHFPVDFARSRRVELDLEMEFGHRLGADSREVSIAVTGVDLLR